MTNNDPDPDRNSGDFPRKTESTVWPEPLKDRGQLGLLWQEKNGRKVPRRVTAGRDSDGEWMCADPKLPENWIPFDKARKFAEMYDELHVGYYLPLPDLSDWDEDDRYDSVNPEEDVDVQLQFGLVDLDYVRDPATDEVSEAAVALLRKLSITFLEWSPSGEGVHAYGVFELPDGIQELTIDISTDAFPDATVELYEGQRYTTITGDYIPESATSIEDIQAVIDGLLDAHPSAVENKRSEYPESRERLNESPPVKSEDEIKELEKTNNIQDIFDAIEYTDPGDIDTRSEVTEVRSNSKSLDPCWTRSESGTRVAQVDDCWIYRKGMLRLDALHMVALEEGITTSPREYPSGEAFWDAVDALRERGADIPIYTRDRAFAMVPATKQTKAVSSGYDWTEHGLEDTELDIETARERTKELISDLVTSNHPRDRSVLVNALPSLGKSYSAVHAAANPDAKITILTRRGRKEQYAQLQEWARELGLDVKVLPSFFEDCPSARGDHGQDLKRRLFDLYNRHATPKNIHVYEGTLPCQEDGPCPFTVEWEFDPDNFDLIIGHYAHAYRPNVTAGRTVIFDEFPGDTYITKLDESLRRGISYFLSQTDSIPVDDFTDFIERRNEEGLRADLSWHFMNEVEEIHDEQSVFEHEEAHATAPLATLALTTSEDLGNGWEFSNPPSIGEDDRYNTIKRAAFHRETTELYLLSPPNLSYARQILALDGTPTPRMWELALGTSLRTQQVLDESERQEYLTNGLDHHYILTTEDIRPYNSRSNINLDKDVALLNAINRHYDKSPAVITSSDAERLYENDGITDDLISGIKHYGNILGSNKFKRTRLGCVIGSNHYGDDFVKRWGALNGEGVERRGRGADLSYSGIGDDILNHMREHETLQAVMRFGRDGHGAVVYVHTNTLPDWVPIHARGSVTQRCETQQTLIDELIDADTAVTASELTERLDVSQRTVNHHLKKLADDGFVETVDNPDDGRKPLYRFNGSTEVNEKGVVDLPQAQVSDLFGDDTSPAGTTKFAVGGSVSVSDP